jgi:hypothetical protein
VLDQSRDRLRVLACSQRKLLCEPSPIFTGCHGGVLVVYLRPSIITSIDVAKLNSI